MSSTVAAILTEGRKLIAAPYGWTRGRYTYRQPRSPSGWAYCAVGALRHAGSELGANNYDITRAEILLNECSYTRYGENSAVRLNDQIAQTKAPILKVYDCAIDKAKADA